MKTLDSIASSLIPTTLIEVKHPLINRDDVRIFAKMENTQETGSVKDRAGKRIISELLNGENYLLILENGSWAKKRLEYDGQTIVDSTSGNFGPALSKAAEKFGIKVRLFAPARMPRILREMVRDYGAELIMTDPCEGYEGARKMAGVEGAKKGCIYTNQYANIGNFNAHFYGTAKEIHEAAHGLTHLVTGVGTGATIMGMQTYLKQFGVKAYAVHPEEGTAGIQGWQNKLNNQIFTPIYAANREILSGSVDIKPEEAMQEWRHLLQQGFDVGMSSAANMAGILKLVKSRQINNGTVVTIFADNFDRYRDWYM